MNSVESDRILGLEVTGELLISIEGIDTIPLSARHGGQTVGFLVGEAEARLTRKRVFWHNTANPPYEVLLFDPDNGQIIVRRK